MRAGTLMGLDEAELYALTFVCRTPVVEGFADWRFERLEKKGLVEKKPVRVTLLGVTGDPVGAYFPTEKGIHIWAVLVGANI